MSTHAIRQRLLLALCLCATALPLAAQTRVQGRVVDEAGAPVTAAMVVFEPPGPASGPSAWTVFSQADGSFSFPEALPLVNGGQQAFRLRALGIAPTPVSATLQTAAGNTATLQLVARQTSNLSDAAPASAWLSRISVASELV